MAKFRATSLLALFITLIGVRAASQAGTLPAGASQEPRALRSSEPVEDITADLERYIPAYMREQNIPGVGIALIYDGEIAWTEGFGAANVLTREAVKADTVFEVASNSKVVTAYLALRLVDQGLLALDEPLNDYLPEPWLPPSAYRDVITLRHVLSHTAGLGHIPPTRESVFAPGQGYSYSSVGFHYLQAVIEQVTGKTLEAAAQEFVFMPLGMSTSSFVNPTELTPVTANGHLHAIAPVLIFILCYVLSLVLVGFVGLVIGRIRTGRWRPKRRMVVGMLVAAFVLALLTGFFLISTQVLPELAWLYAGCAVALAASFAALFLAGRIVIIRLFPDQARQRAFVTMLWTMAVVVGLIFLASKPANVPVPKWPRTEVDAAGSLRATAADMATFLIELAHPQYLSADLAAEFQKPQVTLAEDLSWGLGAGIQSSQYGDALWQWGQHMDFQSVIIIYPEHDFGVVVWTNNDLSNPDVAINIAHRALGGEIDLIRRASHLEFNFREGDM